MTEAENADVFFDVLLAKRQSMDISRHKLITHAIRFGMIDRVVQAVIDRLPANQRTDTTSLITAILRLNTSELAEIIDETGKIVAMWQSRFPHGNREAVTVGS